MEDKPFRKSDYVTEVLSQFETGYIGMATRLTTPGVCERAVTFERNVHRAILLAQLPEFIARETRFLTQVHTTAVQSIQVPAEIIYGSSEHADFVNQRLPKRLLEVQAELNKGGADFQKSQIENAITSMLFIFDPDSGHPALVALQALYISLLVNIWTAFEAMAGDLWEVALNVHPKGLGDLKGKEMRIASKAGYAPTSTSGGEDKVSKYEFALAAVHDVTQGDYDLKNKMGTLLKRRFRFTVLKEMRFAYSRAFSEKYDTIDTVLSDAALDMLSALRNVFVHKAGVADKEYEGYRRGYSKLPQTEIGKQIELDGKTIKERVNSVIKCGTNLLTSVDNWILENP